MWTQSRETFLPPPDAAARRKMQATRAGFLLVLLVWTACGEPEPDQIEHPQLASDAIGPLLVQKDGSLRRIANWAELTGAERSAAMKASTRRNTARLAALRAAEAEAKRSVLSRLGAALVGARRWFQSRPIRQLSTALRRRHGRRGRGGGDADAGGRGGGLAAWWRRRWARPAES